MPVLFKTNMPVTSAYSSSRLGWQDPAGLEAKTLYKVHISLAAKSLLMQISLRLTGGISVLHLQFFLRPVFRS